jgi:hypothetical protein
MLRTLDVQLVTNVLGEDGGSLKSHKSLTYVHTCYMRNIVCRVSIYKHGDNAKLEMLYVSSVT